MSLIVNADPGPSTLLSDAEVALRMAQVEADYRIGARTILGWATCVLLIIAASAAWPWGVM